MQRQENLTYAMVATPVDMRVIKQTPRTPVRTSVDIPVRTSVDTPVRTSVDTPVFGPLPTTVRRPHDAHQSRLFSIFLQNYNTSSLKLYVQSKYFPLEKIKRKKRLVILICCVGCVYYFCSGVDT